MFYYLFDYLDKIGFPGAGVFEYISFRAALAIIASLIVSLIIGKRWIYFLQRKQIGETVRDLGLEGQLQKKGTPTMGGIIILASILIPTLLFAKLDNIYVILMLITTVWLGLIGFLDDYIKVYKKNKEGLKGKFKVIGQIGLGIIVGATFYFSDDIVIREKVYDNEGNIVKTWTKTSDNCEVLIDETVDIKSTKTTIPFFKNNEFDYKSIVSWLGESAGQWVWIIFILATIFIVTAVSNGANLTDGLDGLAAGTSAIIGSTLGILAYVSGNVFFADYLNIMYIPNSGELVIFASALIGATIGFLWYNAYPAQVFMGDTGSLALGGIIAVFAIIIRKELLIPILAGIFLVENLSVILQVSYFKYTKKKFGEGRRIFKMSPLHHHFQKSGYVEPKIVIRFWIVGIMLAVITIITLKLR
jgi:phospho-N-acetylmuramoyl-pentapeptide-transferase